MKPLKACIELGLNIHTGESDFIALERIEDLTGKRITGNGSTMRRDSKPWLFFNMEIIKFKAAVKGFQFNGYKTRREKIGELDNQNSSSSKRIKLEENMIETRTEEKTKLNKNGKLDEKIYSIHDVKRYV